MRRREVCRQRACTYLQRDATSSIWRPGLHRRIVGSTPTRHCFRGAPPGRDGAVPTRMRTRSEPPLPGDTCTGFETRKAPVACAQGHRRRERLGFERLAVLGKAWIAMPPFDQPQATAQKPPQQP